MTDQPLVFRRCGLPDAPELMRLAQAALATDTFYCAVFGFDEREFNAYWRAYFQMVLTDPAAEVVALVTGDRLVACGAIGYPGFPCAETNERFESDLCAALAPARQTSYARFLTAYDELMTSPDEQARTEAQVLWLFVEQPHRGAGLVAQMLQAWNQKHRPADIRVLCGMVNGGAPELLASYHRIGFHSAEPKQVCGLLLTRVTLQLDAARPGTRPQGA